MKSLVVRLCQMKSLVVRLCQMKSLVVRLCQMNHQYSLPFLTCPCGNKISIFFRCFHYLFICLSVHILKETPSTFVNLVIFTITISSFLSFITYRYLNIILPPVHSFMYVSLYLKSICTIAINIKANQN